MLKLIKMKFKKLNKLLKNYYKLFVKFEINKIRKT